MKEKKREGVMAVFGGDKGSEFEINGRLPRRWRRERVLGEGGGWVHA